MYRYNMLGSLSHTSYPLRRFPIVSRIKGELTAAPQDPQLAALPLKSVHEPEQHAG
jgi:hypothetical protein